MLKKKEVLFEQLSQFQNLGEIIYVGKNEDIKNNFFDTENLYVAHLVHLINGTDHFKKSDFKYVFEKKQYADMIIYKELFSGAELERVDLKKVLSSRGMYIINPVSYDDYIANILSLREDKSQEEYGVLKKVRVQA